MVSCKGTCHKDFRRWESPARCTVALPSWVAWRATEGTPTGQAFCAYVENVGVAGVGRDKRVVVVGFEKAGVLTREEHMSDGKVQAHRYPTGPQAS